MFAAACLSVAPTVASATSSSTAQTQTTTPPTTTTPVTTTTTRGSGTSTTSSKKGVYLIRVGSFKNKTAANALLAKVKAAGVKGFVVVKHKNGRYWVQESQLSNHNGWVTFRQLTHAHIKAVLLVA